MRKKSVLGIYREPIYSHNALDADRLILEQALAHLEKASVKVSVVEAADLAECRRKVDLVLTMAQGKECLSRLSEWEKANQMVWNSTSGVRACYREEMSKRLAKVTVGYPPSLVISKQHTPPVWLRKTKKSFWLKRGDVHAITDEDVCRANSGEEIAALLERFYSRSIPKVIVQEHREGQVFKFYGVKNEFFHCHLFNPMEHEVVALPVGKLHHLAETAANIMGLEIYGGDCVLGPEGDMHIIDMNDWPSFRRCRKEAAEAIFLHALNFLFRGKSLAQSHSYRIDTVAKNVYQSRPAVLCIPI